MTKGKRVEPSEANDKTEQQPAAAAATKPAEPVAAASDKKGSDGKRPKPGKPAAGGGGRGVSLLALLLALIALAASGWQWWQAQSLQQAQRNALAQQQAQLDRANLRLDQRLQGVPQGDDWQAAERLIAEMQRSQQALGERLDVLQGDGREEWKLAEAQYLLRLAALRLQAVQDVSAARELLETVDGILKSMPDSGLYGVREQLAGYQAELEGLPELDRAGVFLRLGALRDQVDRLVALPVPEFDPPDVSAEEEYADRLQRRDRWDRVLMRLERYVRVDFQRGKVITPLLDEAEMQRVRRTLQLTLEQAQWAALRGEETVYQASLDRAEQILTQYFELENPKVQAMQGQLQELHGRAVSLSPPDLAPLQQSLANYLQSRRSSAPAEEAADE